MAYSDKVLDHYTNPRNVGSLDKNSQDVGTGMVGAPECGDVMKLQVKVNPATGVNYTKPEWAAAAATELTAVNAGFGGTVYSNTYCSGRAYYNFPMSAANDATSLGFEAEHWMTSTASGAHTLKIWRQGINMMIDSQAHGKVVTVSEHAMDAVTAVSGSGPAYVFLLAEALEKAAMTEGLSADAAKRLARATVAGAGAMLDAVAPGQPRVSFLFRLRPPPQAMSMDY